MDEKVKHISNLTDRDIDLLYQIEAGLPLTADVSRADVLLCCLLGPTQALVAHHTEPTSISSLYRQNVIGRIFTPDEQPLLFRTLRNGSMGRRQRQVISSGAPAIQDAFPIYNVAGTPIAGLLVETNMLEHERHRRRERKFRRAVRWLQEMTARGEIENAESLQRFGPYDGIYLVESDRRLAYINGIATNMFRSIGRLTDMRGQHVSVLEEADAELVEQAIVAHRCIEMRRESEDGRIWVRQAVPLRVPPTTWSLSPVALRRHWANFPWQNINGSGSLSKYGNREIDAALVLLHNATEQVQRQRELNVKSAIIQEVHHRVKNNLQTIAAMMRIQARRSSTDEARQQLLDAVNRILSMSVIHEFLSQDEHRPINIREVCQRIATQVAQVVTSPDQHVDIQVTGPNIRLPAGQATPAAMVVNELLLNAMEHGLSGREQGHIEVQLDDLGDAVQVTILDDGHGLPAGFDPNHSSSLGLQIVHTLVTDDLKGELHMEPVLSPSAATLALVSSGREGNGDAEPNQLANHGVSIPFSTRATVIFPKRSLGVD